MPGDVRLFYLVGASHFSGWGAQSKEAKTCRFGTNPVSSARVMRALLVSLRAWVADGTEPPASRFPTLADGTLVPLGKLAPPDMPGDDIVLNYNVLRVQDLSSVPPRAGAAYPVFVPQVDVAGIGMGGVSMARVAASLGTYLGWNLRKDGFAPGELCSLTGSFMPFATAAAKGVGCPSVSARYADADAYAEAVAAKAQALVDAGLMLADDIQMSVELARKDFPAAD